MSTKGIIDRVVPWCPGWERQSGKKNLLKVLEQGVDKLFDFDHDCMIYRGTDNEGFPPYLVTIAGTYDYNVEAANLSCGNIVRTIGGTSYTFVAKRVNKVFVDITRTSYEETSWFGTPYYLETSPYATETARRRFVNWRISSQPGYENSPPTIKFQSDPGDSTETYFIEFFIGPPRLSSDLIRIPVPQEFESDLENYIIGFVQWRESGRANDYMQYFENVTIPKFQRIMDSCANTCSTRCVPNYA